MTLYHTLIDHSTLGTESYEEIFACLQANFQVIIVTHLKHTQTNHTNKVGILI